MPKFDWGLFPISMNRLFNILVISFCCAICCAQKSDIDFKRGEIQIRPEPETGLIEGEVLYSFEKGRGPDSLWLDAPGMEIGQVLLNEQPVPYSQAGNRVGVRAPAATGQHRLRIRYRAYPRQTVYFLGWDDAVQGNEQIWTQGQGKYSSHWVPSFDDMREKVKFDLGILFRPGYSVIANGRLTGVSEADSLRRWQFEMEHPMSSYLLAFAIGRFDSLELRSRSGVPLRLYFPPGATQKATYTYKYSREMFDFLESEIGVPYPWQEYKQVPLRDFMYAGMENTTATFFDDSYLVDSLGFNDHSYANVNAHEMAHHWFGDLVTETDGSQHWLHEGFATYYAYLAEEAVLGREYLDWKLLNTARLLEDLDKRGEGASLLDPQAGSLIFYEKGAWALFLLRDLLGDDAFRRGIRQYLQAFAFANATVDDFLGTMQHASGVSLQAFRQQWLEPVTFPIGEALSFLGRRSARMAAFLGLHEEVIAGDSLAAEVLTAAWEASEAPGYRAALLREFRPSFGEAHLRRALESPEPEVQKALLGGLDRADPWMFPYLEKFLDAPSYEVRGDALLKLWMARPTLRSACLDQAAENGSLADLKVQQLWWVLALFTDSYAPLERRVTYLESLRETTDPAYNRDIRQNAFGLLRQIDALDDKNQRDLIRATEHHSWQFRIFARRLLDELMQQRPERAFWESLAPGFPEASFPYFYAKINAL